MAYEEVKIDPKPYSKKALARIGVRRSYGSIKIVLSISGEIAREARFSNIDKFAAFIDRDGNKLALAKDDRGPLACRQLKNGGGLVFEIRAQIGAPDHPTIRVACEARVTEAGWVEIDLPDWSAVEALPEAPAASDEEMSEDEKRYFDDLAASVGCGAEELGMRLLRGVVRNDLGLEALKGEETNGV